MRSSDNFENRIGEAGAQAIFEGVEKQLLKAGYIARGGQIVDAPLIPVPRQRLTAREKEAIEQGTVPEDWNEAKRRNTIHLSPQSREVDERIHVHQGIAQTVDLLFAKVGGKQVGLDGTARNHGRLRLRWGEALIVPCRAGRKAGFFEVPVIRQTFR